MTFTPPLLNLPSELLHIILGYLSLPDLLSVGLVNKALHEHSEQDALYHPFVQSHVPGYKVPKPANCSWRDLYKLHYPYWFIPKNKIWFSDNAYTGKLVIARYDHRLNIIEAYALVAERRQPTFQTWEWNPEAIIHSFNPRIQLDLNAPVLRLDPEAYEYVEDNGSRLTSEIPMTLFDSLPSSTGIRSRLMLTRPWPAHITSPSTPIWPPLTLPSSTRTRNDSPSDFRDNNHKPSTLSELSTSNFRIRKWVSFSSRPHGFNLRVGEAITTWGTLPEECYTPTRQKPWQGIWVGDYAGHGCEFLVVMQPDDPKPLPDRAEWAMRAREREGSVSSAGSWSTAPTEATNNADAWSDGESNDLFAEPEASLEDSISTLHANTPESTYDEEVEKEDKSVYRGRLEAVKLTGDPNIPRGEYTFIAPDIGPDGLIRVANEEMFKGAHIVKSVGHIAANNFRNDDYMTSQLILISHDRLAQYWETFGHVSFYQRVNIDDFTKLE
ncbi:hypothetical protein BS50DRAFT_602959 [Corynespora cassiicola Philippines]|uniref:F-box domain-containing protein n=1 Tax=Corynespora cassiicola Philippines TaxID=1448308 RepID=A0A2T2ND47_CORCC|nr:hypothetical protein BS50DRAFT_602959 [Corynespora cassiicola Philippines]